MRLLVAPDSAMYKTPDGKYWCPTIYEYSFFERYLQVFEDIVVASRVKQSNYEEVNSFLRCDGPHMTVIDLPDMHGMSDYIKKLIPFARAAKKAVTDVDCAIIRLPSMPASMVLHYYKKTGKKYALEVVADPEDAYVENALAKTLFSKLLKRQCLEADGVSYVTKDFLQIKYPSYVRTFGDDGKHFESSYSTIRLQESYFGKAKNYIGKKKYTIIHTANNMNNNVKGHDVLLQVLKEVVDEGYDVLLRFVGDGALRGSFEEKTRQLGLDNRVIFVGRLASSNAVRKELINADMLVFPTKAEGLPRTVIEAMAVGLPCISTPVAGIPELLEDEDMISPNDIDGFAKRIIEFITNPTIMNNKSLRNLDVAMNYSEINLRIKRNDYYAKLRKLTEQGD